MKTIILDKPGELRLCDTPAPNAIDDLPVGHALVRVRSVGICGTDWHALHGRQPFFNYPRILGHELGVEIEAVNDPAGDFPGGDLKRGDRCCVEPYLNCGKCIACRNGKGNCCVDLKVMGVHVDGGMREHIVLPVKKLHQSKKLTLEQLALVETLAIGCHAVSRANPKTGENVLVVGAGPIGLSVIPFVQATGAEPIVADVSDTRLAFCTKQMGVRHTIDARGDVASQLKELLGGELPTVVIDATGNPPSMMKSFDLIAHGGRIVFVGLFQGDVTFNDPNFHRRELTLMGSRNALPDDFERIIKLVEDGAVDTTPWITHRGTVDSMVQLMPQWEAPGSGLLKAMVQF
jgi:2-desacetyl-2-hydroxyethyl bacteriochlorophyllide A dehydrogenase